MEMVNVKAMPGSIPAPNSGSIVEKKIRKIQVAKWGKLTKNHLKKNYTNVIKCFALARQESEISMKNPKRK